MSSTYWPQQLSTVYAVPQIEGLPVVQIDVWTPTVYGTITVQIAREEEK